jgi:hypothetical protein
MLNTTDKQINRRKENAGQDKSSPEDGGGAGQATGGGERWVWA